MPLGQRGRYRLAIAGDEHRAPLVPGQRLGRYELIERLEVGDVGERWLTQAAPDEWAVVERLAPAPQTLIDHAAVGRLLEDARALAPLRHAHLLPILAVSSASEPGFVAFAQRQGDDLSVVLRALVERGQRMPIAHALQLGIALAAALHHVHESRAADGRPVLHGHVSPARVRIGQGGTIELLLGPAAASAERLVYFSPEQRRGETIDRRSDVFALGALLYELTVGRRLYTEAALAPPRSLDGGYDARLEEIVLRALDRERTRRFATARALQSALEALAYAGPPASSAPSLAAWVRALVGSGWEAPEVTLVERGRTALPLPRPDATRPTRLASRGEPSSWLGAARPAWLQRSWQTLVALAIVAFTAGATAGLLRRARHGVPAKPPVAAATTTAATPATPVATAPRPPRAVGGGPSASTGTMQIVTVPGGATLRLDGQKLPQRSPARLTGLDAGAVHVLAVELGARGVTEHFVLAPDEEASLEIDLHPKRHRHKTLRRRGSHAHAP